jgi:hypothetical protein
MIACRSSSFPSLRFLAVAQTVLEALGWYAGERQRLVVLELRLIPAELYFGDGPRERHILILDPLGPEFLSLFVRHMLRLVGREGFVICIEGFVVGQVGWQLKEAVRPCPCWW